MFSLQRKFFLGFLGLFSSVLMISCEGLFADKEEKEPLARVGDVFLYKEDVAAILDEGLSQSDSALFVTNYINDWASKQLLLSKSKINLPEEKISAFDLLVDDYRAELYTRAYLEALVFNAQDTTITESQLKKYYEQEKENFRLSEKLVQLRFVGLPEQFLDKEEVNQRMSNWSEQDKRYMDSISIQFRKIHFNDSVWVSTARIREEIPPLTALNEDEHLKKSQFFELADSTSVYLGKVTDVLEVNDVAPFEYVAPRIRQLILNRRRLDYIRKLKTEIIDEATKENEFEVYGK